MDLIKLLRLLSVFLFIVSLTTNASSQVIVSTLGNNPLTCIAVNDTDASAGAPGWKKDAIAEYRESCSVLGITDMQHFDFKLLQNPILNGQLRFITTDPGTLTLYSITGIQLRTNAQVQSGENLLRLNDLAPNLYIAKITTPNGTAVKKVILK